MLYYSYIRQVAHSALPPYTQEKKVVTTNGSLTMEVACGDCGSTGIYRGFAEPKGVGVVCLSCNGSGKAKLTYKPFKGRKQRDDVQTVRLSAGSFIGTGVGPCGSSISYQEFLKGSLPSM